MKSALGKTILILVALLIVFPAVLQVLTYLFGPVVVPLSFLLLMVYGWMIHTFLQYRLGRQDEFLTILAGAADAGTPLPSTLRAYLQDRPSGPWKRFWTALALFFVLPGYYWLWHKRRSFDARLARVTRSLELGEPLQDALRSEPGVASPTVLLAVAVGESSGKMALSLRRSIDTQLASVWMETMPRFLYPLALLFFLNGILVFWSLYLLPRMIRLFLDFGISLPELTLSLARFAHFFQEYSFLIVPLLILVFGLGVLACFSPDVRWYLPGIGRLYRKSLQSQSLKMLAVLLESGKTLPESLAILADSGAFPRAVVRQLQRGKALAEQGTPLPDVLESIGLVPGSMVPLVRAAERAANLPWACAELGHTLAQRTVFLAQQASLTGYSLSIALIGVLVGCMVLAMFLPLITLLTELA